MSEINDTIIKKAMELSLKERKAEGLEILAVPFCWLALGSEGREEQLLRTDQDNALIFGDVAADEQDAVKKYFLDVSKRTTRILAACGFVFCPADMMASNPKWCNSISEWKEIFQKWISQPGPNEVMHSTIFFDFRPITGDKNLANELTNCIFEAIEKTDLFLSLLSKDALRTPPPLSFFRNFIVERSGEHKDQFDIKLRAMMPLADAARVLILNAKVPAINNTFKRFRKLAELEPNQKELFEEAAEAYEILMRFRALQGLANKDSGRYINPMELNKMQRMMLKNTFKSINELQELLSIRFRLNLFG